MIAEKKTKSSFTPQVIDVRFPTQPLTISRIQSGALCQERDREVPYGMKGGEH